MSETGEDATRRPREPNWVDIGTLIVLTLTLIAVIIYACEAHIQNILTRQTIELQSRPYIALGFSHDQLQTGNGGIRISWPVNITNAGKLPGDSYIKALVAYSTTDLNNGPSLDAPCVQERHIFVWPGGTDPSTIATSCDALTSGQLTDFRAGNGWLFAVADIRYGQGHHTQVCYKFAASSNQSAGPSTGTIPQPSLRPPELCSDPKSNHAD